MALVLTNYAKSLATTTSFDYRRGCKVGISLDTFSGITRSSCRRKCVEYGSTCLGAEYRTSSGTGECSLSNSTVTTVCNNNVDFYAKQDYLDVVTLAPTVVPAPTMSPSLVRAVLLPFYAPIILLNHITLRLFCTSTRAPSLPRRRIH